MAESEVSNLKIMIDNLQMSLKGKEQQIRDLDVKIAVMKKQEHRELVDKKEVEHQQEQYQLSMQNMNANIKNLKQREGALELKVKEQAEVVEAQKDRIGQLDEEVAAMAKKLYEAQKKLEHVTKLEKRVREQLDELKQAKMEVTQQRDAIHQEKKSNINRGLKLSRF